MPCVFPPVQALPRSSARVVCIDVRPRSSFGLGHSPGLCINFPIELGAIHPAAQHGTEKAGRQMGRQRRAVLCVCLCVHVRVRMRVRLGLQQSFGCTVRWITPAPHAFPFFPLNRFRSSAIQSPLTPTPAALEGDTLRGPFAAAIRRHARGRSVVVIGTAARGDAAKVWGYAELERVVEGRASLSRRRCTLSSCRTGFRCVS